MKELQFIALRRPDWEAWDKWLEPSKKKSGSTETDETAAPSISVENMGTAFRRLCHDLSIAKSRQYSANLQETLQQRVLAVHQRIYSTAPPRRNSVLEFIGGGFPRLVRQEWRLVLAATLLFFVPLILMIIIPQFYPDSVYLFLSHEQAEQMRAMYRPEGRSLDWEESASSNWKMWGFYIANNVRIDFQVFASGLVFGVGSIFFILFNGLFIGSVAGHLTQIGYIETFWGFVSGHAAFELTGIVLSGAAGLRLGLALIAPGQLTRKAALKNAAHQVLGLIYGAAALTFLAAFIEAFWSPLAEIPFNIKVGIGIAFWLVTLAYLLFAGRASREN